MFQLEAKTITLLRHRSDALFGFKSVVFDAAMKATQSSVCQVLLQNVKSLHILIL